MRPRAVSRRALPPRRTVRAQGWSATAAGWGVGLGVTALILWTPYLPFGLRSPSLHLVLDTLDAAVALLVAFLLHGRFRRDHRWQDGMLAYGLVLLAGAGLGLSYLAQALPHLRPGTIEVWIPMTGRVVGALCILLAAALGSRPAPRRWQGSGLLLVLVVGVLLISGGLWLLRERLPVALDPSGVPAASGHVLLSGHPFLLGSQGLAAGCFLAASLLFARQARTGPDHLLRCLGPACALGGFARLNYVLFPSLYTEWVYTGDVLRTGSYVLLLVGAARELNAYFGQQTTLAVLEDRRRLARELHDGVLQELAYIRAESFALPADWGVGDRIQAACDRGLDEARAAVQALGHADDEPLAHVLRRAASEMASRYHVLLDLEVDPSIRVDADQQHALMRITREAVANAVRHGQAAQVQVRLRRDGEHRQLCIEDDGQGFDVNLAQASATGYGLVSMRDRAQALPGSLAVRTGSGRGSQVTVTW
ncbi:MAG: hypothetical protein JWP61_734 [Friedmanniella sp.]|nr:hypothetical protein [Friedmanniella sp.]